MSIFCVTGLGETCMYDTDCKEYTYCYNREECKCKENYTSDQKARHCVPGKLKMKGVATPH